MQPGAKVDGDDRANRSSLMALSIICNNIFKQEQVPFIFLSVLSCCHALRGRCPPSMPTLLRPFLRQFSSTALAMSSPFVLIVDLQIAAGNESAVVPLMLKNAAASRQEPGCIAFEVLRAPEDPAKIRFYEVYKDKDAFEAHQKTEHFKEWLENGVPMLASRQRSVWEKVQA